jgi:hypothetical protein
MAGAKIPIEEKTVADSRIGVALHPGAGEKANNCLS